MQYSCSCRRLGNRICMCVYVQNLIVRTKIRQKLEIDNWAYCYGFLVECLLYYNLPFVCKLLRRMMVQGLIGFFGYGLGFGRKGFACCYNSATEKALLDVGNEGH